MRLILILIIISFSFGVMAQVDNSLDSHEQYLTVVKNDAELYEMHKSANSYMGKAEGFGTASGVLLLLAAFGAANTFSDGAADPNPGSLVLATVGGLIGGLFGLIALGSYGKAKTKRKKIKHLMNERYGLIDNYTIDIQSTSNGIGLVMMF